LCGIVSRFGGAFCQSKRQAPGRQRSTGAQTLNIARHLPINNLFACRSSFAFRISHLTFRIDKTVSVTLCAFRLRHTALPAQAEGWPIRAHARNDTHDSRRPLLRSPLHAPLSVSLDQEPDQSPSSRMSSPPDAYQPSTPHIRLNSGSDDLVNMADQDHQATRQPSSRSLTRPGTAGSASIRPSLHPAPSTNSLYNAG